VSSVPNIPRGPGDVTPAWLSAVLGVDVEQVGVTPIGGRVLLTGSLDLIAH
jgi:hypothetical protein